MWGYFTPVRQNASMPALIHMLIKKFEDIEAWKTARVLCSKIYELTRQDSIKRDYELINQIRGASVSVMSNIAEGFSRKSPKEFSRFLDIASASVCEVKSILYVCLDQNYIDQTSFNELTTLVDKTDSLINGFIAYLVKNQK